MKKQITKYCAIASLLCIAGAASPALAVDGKTLPGAACQPAYDSYGIYRDYVGRIFNRGTSYQYWTCPIVRDVTAGKYNGMYRARLFFIDQHSTGNGSCTLYSRSATGGYVSSRTRNTNSSSGGAQYLYWGPYLKTASNGYNYFRCGVPGTYGGRRSGIVSYNWEEY